ncbi:MAG: peptidylprolyl isomerase [Ruminococcaceae bacterium]|nr:peptidylprolyl isomerase [Oscillospiraceae bacterium]
MDNKILASVAGNPITENEVNEMIASMGQRGRAYNTPEGREAILDQLINRALLLLDAKKNLFEREPAFKEQLAKLKEELLANYCVEKVISEVKVTDAEAKTYFEEHKEMFVSEGTVNASHILVEDEEKCAAVLAEINAGELSFEDAAARYSSCPSKEAGGNLGDFGRGQMVPEFENAAFEMEEGEVKGPVVTQFGCHIIKLNKKNAPREYAFEEIAPQLKEQLLRDKQQKAYQSKVNQLKIMYMVDKF